MATELPTHTMDTIPAEWDADSRILTDALAVAWPRRPEPTPNHIWAAMTLAHTADTCQSILAGRAVRAGNLDAIILRHALRGAALPPADTYITITDAHLDSVVEAGPVQ